MIFSTTIIAYDYLTAIVNLDYVRLTNLTSPIVQSVPVHRT